VPQVGVVEEDIALLLVDRHLAGHPLESGRQAGDAAPVAPGQHPEEAVGRRGGIEVDGEGDPGPDVEMGTRLVVGVPTDP